MSRVREEALYEEMGDTRWLSPQVLALAAAALVLLFIGLRPLWQGAPPQVQLLGAESSEVRRAGQSLPMASGVGSGPLVPADVVATGNSGTADLRWSAGGRSIDVRLGPDTELKLLQTVPLSLELNGGEVQVAAIDADLRFGPGRPEHARSRSRPIPGGCDPDPPSGLAYRGASPFARRPRRCTDRARRRQQAGSVRPRRDPTPRSARWSSNGSPTWRRCSGTGLVLSPPVPKRRGSPFRRSGHRSEC